MGGGFTNMLLFLINQGDVEFFLAVSFINGTPLGARFLADTILSDIIDYDEFLSGRRSEATFLMFKSFLPKMVGLPAAVLPIAFLPLVGYNTESAAIGAAQPTTAMWYLKFLSGPVSTIFCVASFVVKLRFPLKTEQQVNAIGLGVALHVAGKSAPDPLSNNDPPQLYSLVDIQSKQEQHLANIINHFPGPGVIRRMLGLNEDGTPVNDRLKFETTRQDEVNNQVKKVVKQVVYLFLYFAFICIFGI